MGGLAAGWMQVIWHPPPVVRSSLCFSGILSYLLSLELDTGDVGKAEERVFWVEQFPKGSRQSGKPVKEDSLLFIGGLNDVPGILQA